MGFLIFEIKFLNLIKRSRKKKQIEYMENKKTSVKFRDITGFEKYAMDKGYVLCDGDYPTNYFSTYGTIVRHWKKEGRGFSVGLIGDPIRIGILPTWKTQVKRDGNSFTPFIDMSNTFLPSENQYADRLAFLEANN